MHTCFRLLVHSYTQTSVLDAACLYFDWLGHKSPDNPGNHDQSHEDRDKMLASLHRYSRVLSTSTRSRCRSRHRTRSPEPKAAVTTTMNATAYVLRSITNGMRYSSVFSHNDMKSQMPYPIANPRGIAAAVR